MEILTQQVDLVAKIVNLARIEYLPQAEGDANPPQPASPIIANPQQFIAWTLRKNLNLTDSEVEMFMGDPSLGMTEDDVALQQLSEAESLVKNDEDFISFEKLVQEIAEDNRSGDGDENIFEESAKSDIDYQDSFFVAHKRDVTPGAFDIDKQESSLRESLGVKEGDPIIKCPACKEQGMSIRKDEIEENTFLFCPKCGHSQ